VSDSAKLERRYRRLLACYPQAFRQEHEQEILGVLMAGADEDQHRPRPGGAVDLIKYAVSMRLGRRQGEDMDIETMFPMKVDRPSRVLVAGLGAGHKGPRVTASSSTVDVRMGWGFHATLAREDVASARPLTGGLGELPGPLRLSGLRGVNYWRGTALVNGAGTDLVEITLDRPSWVRLGPFPVRMRRLIVSAEDPSGLVAALNPKP
jgi:hypothetical protein